MSARLRTVYILVALAGLPFGAAIGGARPGELAAIVILLGIGFAAGWLARGREP